MVASELTSTTHLLPSRGGAATTDSETVAQDAGKPQSPIRVRYVLDGQVLVDATFSAAESRGAAAVVVLIGAIAPRNDQAARVFLLDTVRRATTRRGRERAALAVGDAYVELVVDARPEAVA